MSTQNLIRKEKKKKRKLEGISAINDILFEDLNTLNEGEVSEQTSTSTPNKRISLLPISCKSVSPIECIRSIVNNYEIKDYENIYSTNIYFLLENMNKMKIEANTTSKIQASIIFKPFHNTLNKVKQKTRRDEIETLTMLETKMKYFLVSELNPNSFIQIQVTYGMLSDLLTKPLFLNIANYHSEEFEIPEKTLLCKIFFHFDKQVNHQEEILI